MEARFWKAIGLMAIVASLGAGRPSPTCRTPNFLVQAPTQALADEIGAAAEKYRHDLAIDWLGKALPTWSRPCPVRVQCAPNLGAGGVTSFAFDHGEVFGWEMTIQGSRERLLDSVLPHEVTHTIFASHFRQPLPRWADEGACTTVEDISERSKQQNLLVDFLQTGRGIPFNKMFAMREYPHDILPLYSQGYSLARLLIQEGGRRKFIEFLADGMASNNWPQAVAQHYGYRDLGVLQEKWVAWVRQGSPAPAAATPAVLASNQVAVTAPAPARSLDEPQLNAAPAGPQPVTLLASNQTARRSRPEPNLIYRQETQEDAMAQARVVTNAPVANDGTPVWHSETPARSAAVGAVGRTAAEPPYQTSRAQSPEPARQIILEWSKADPGNVYR